jgi:hypothetical protein
MLMQLDVKPTDSYFKIKGNKLYVFLVSQAQVKLKAQNYL